MPVTGRSVNPQTPTCEQWRRGSTLNLRVCDRCRRTLWRPFNVVKVLLLVSLCAEDIHLLLMIMPELADIMPDFPTIPKTNILYFRLSTDINVTLTGQS